MIRKHRKTLSLCLKASTLLVSLSSGYGRAYAGSCTGAGGTYVCTGSASLTQSDGQFSINIAGPITVTTSNGFGIDTTSGSSNAFRLYSSQGIVFTDTFHSNIFGGGDGILSVNNGANGLLITSNGEIKGKNGQGIWAHNSSSNGGNLTISTAKVTGAQNGILTRNFISGSLSITATGAVEGTTRDGIYAVNYSGGTDLTISTASVTGGEDGIVATNNGSGRLSITSTGLVKGTSGVGIWANNSSHGTDLNITSAEVFGGRYGIDARNSGNGNLSITSNGGVTGLSKDGINAFNFAGGKNLNISTASVTGGEDGIVATNNGSGSLSITSTALVKGNSGIGIWANNSSHGTDLNLTATAVEGGTHGIKTINQGSGHLQISSTGPIIGGTHGIYAVNQGSSSLSITTTGRVEGTTGKGIWVDNRATGTALTISTADVIGGNDGINANNSGSGNLSITTDGTIEGGVGSGIWANNSGSGGLSITTRGSVTGQVYGIYAANDGDRPTEINVLGQLVNNSGFSIFSTGAPTTVNLFAGSTTTGDIRLTDGNDTINLAGNLTGSALMGNGNDTFTQVGGSTLIGAVDGGNGIDTLGFNNMGTVNNNVIGATYLNFENLGIFGGNTTLTGVWDFSGGSTTISSGNLFLNGSLSTNAFVINNGGYANIAGTLNSSSVKVGGSMDVGGTVNTGAFMINNGGYANIAGILNSSSVTVDGRMNVGGTVNNSGAFMINNGGYTNIAGTLNSSSVTVGGSMDVGGTVNTGAFTINNGGNANIAGILNSGSVTVDDRMNIGGTVNNTGAFMINSGGYANVNGLLNSSSVTVDGSMDLGGTLNTDVFTIGRGGFTRITGTLSSDTATVYGGMNLNGTVTADNLMIASGGLLSGSGRVNGSLVNYGTISPGNSIGTLRVNGSARFMPGSIYQAEIHPNGSSDRIDVSGPVSLNGGTVKTALSRSLYTNGQNWKLISATGGINGRFAGLSYRLDSETVDLELAYTSKEVMLEIVRTPFSSFGLTPAGNAVGAGLDEVVPIAVGNMAGFITSMDFDMSRPQIGNVLNALSPEMYTSFSAAGLQGANVFADATTQHQAEFRQGRVLGLTSLTDKNPGGESEWTLWSRALGNWSERDSDVGAMGYNQELGGLVAGTDRQITEVLRAGVDIGYTDSDLEWDGTEHSGSMEGKHIGLYASAEPGDFFIDASGSYSEFTADASRIISFDGLSTEADSGFDANVWSGVLEGGYNYKIKNWLLSPIASLSYAQLSQDGFSEYGADFLNLDITGTDLESLSSTLGLRFSGLIANGQWQFMPSLDLRWLHQFEDEGATVTANFTNYESATFDVTGIAPVSDQGMFSLGLTAEYNKNLSLFVDYGVAAADGYSSQLISGGLSWNF